MKQQEKSKVAKKLTTHVLEMLGAISNGINETIYISDPRTYEILFANKKTKEGFGRNIIGKKCYEAFRKQEKPCPSCTNKRIFGKNLGKTYMWDHQNKWNKRWYKGICKAVPWPGGKYVRYGMAIDITKQKDIQSAVKKSTRGLEQLMKSTTEVMHAKDMHQRLEAIASAIRKLGWRRVVISLRDENLEGTDLVTVGLTKKEKELLAKRKAPGQIWRKRLGPEFEPYKINEFYYLPWSDSWIRENVHGLPQGSSPNEATTYAGVPSQLSTEEMIDWHPQDMLYAPLLTPEGRVVGILSMDDPSDGRKPTKEALAPLELFLHQAAMVIENAQLIESLREVRTQLEAHTEQLEQMVDKRTKQLRKSQEQLLKAQRLAVIGELAGMVGHDLRNPLTSIAGATYYLKKKAKGETSGKIVEMFDLIENNIRYSNKIINDLLDYSREIKLDLTVSDPKTMVQNALALTAIPKNVCLADFTGKKPSLRIDNEKMKRVFANLVKNATDAMPRGGTLTIKSKNTKNHVEFVFADSGTGMKKETMEKLWTPLFTTKAKGMGFGLPICKRFIEAHGGSISVESVFSKGTTITVLLPIEPKTKKEGGGKIWIRQPESLLLTTTKT